VHSAPHHSAVHDDPTFLQPGLQDTDQALELRLIELLILRKQIQPAIVVTLMLCVTTGLIYPAAVTGIAQALFPRPCAA
jgi:K+-transporting ATPase C subunit